jgi:hypothetical protein
MPSRRSRTTTPWRAMRGRRQEREAIDAGLYPERAAA